MIRLMQGDCMEELKKLEDESVDLILTDPPYGTIKGLRIEKPEGYAENKRNDWDDVVDIPTMLTEFHRVLRPKGRAIIFGNNGYTQELRNASNGYMKYVYPLYWVKNRFANPLAARTAPLSYVEDMTVFYKTNGKKIRQRDYIRKVYDYIGKDRKEVAEDLDVKKTILDRSWHERKQFSIPTEELYKKLEDRYKLDNMEGYLTYDGLLEVVKEETPAPAFNIPEGKGHAKNVFEVAKDSYGKNALHPTQKPVLLMEQLIEIFSNEGDVILDAFMGSGSTGVACQNTGREFIGIEIDEEYFRLSEERLKENGARIEGARSSELE